MKVGDKVIINGETFYIFDVDSDCGWFGGGLNREDPKAKFYVIDVCQYPPILPNKKTSDQK
jgi:hypothetical protein